jgi:hypothetical protein
MSGHPLDMLTSKINRAFGGELEAGNHPQRGRFATSRWTKHGKKFTITDFEIERINGSHRPKPLCDLL